MDYTPLPPSAVLQHSHLVYHAPNLPSAAPAAPLAPAPVLARGYRSRIRPAMPSYAVTTTYPRSPFLSSFSSSASPPRGHSTSASGSASGSAAWSARYGRYHASPPPEDGSSPISALPDELVVCVLAQLEWDELLPLRLVCRRWAELALSPGLHQSLTLLSLPSVPLPPVLETRVLPCVRHLHLHLFPYPSLSRPSTPPTSALLALLEAIPPTQLASLSLPFSAPYLHGDEVGDVLKRAGGRLEMLDLRGSGLVGGRWLDWLGHVGIKGQGLVDLDLGFTGITDLPIDDSGEGVSAARTPGDISLLRLPEPRTTPLFSRLRNLSLASCAHLPPSVIASFLANLPPSLERLDLSRLDQVTFQALWEMRVVRPASSAEAWYTGTTDDFPGHTAPEPTQLREIKVVGIDHLTRRDIRAVKRHWEAQRRACYPGLAAVWAAQQVPVRPRVMGVPRTPPARPLVLEEEEEEEGEAPMLTREGSPASAASSLSSGGSPRLLTPSSSVGSVSGGRSGSPTAGRGLKLHPLLHGLQLPLSPSPASACASPAPARASSGHMHCGPGQRTLHEEAISTLERLKINIMHSAILESEDEAGYRQFIGEVAGGVVVPALGVTAGAGVGEMSMDLLING